MTNSSEASHAHIDYELLSHIAHEARGPFNGLIGFSDLLDSGFDSLPIEKQKEYIRLVRLLASKSFFHVQTVLAWLKLISGNFKINLSSFYLSEAFKLAIQYNANDIRSKDIEVSFDHREMGKMEGDLNYISLALANLVAFILPYIQKKTHLLYKIETTDNQNVSIQLTVTLLPQSEDLTTMLELLRDAKNLPESRTSIWVAGQILSLHQSTIQTARTATDQITITLIFP